ncbi:MAG: fumarylacetoacetate hydrolase family protein [Acidobacteriota bacterium]|nr:MAG: fumarylacetoacetate hydrolase family protein [Acidobacteriota bacterium]
MRLFRVTTGAIIEKDGRFYEIQDAVWDDLLNRDDLPGYLDRLLSAGGSQLTERSELPQTLLPPVGSQEIWAAGVTYLRSREARKEEAEEAGGGDFYQRVYEADRPELFLKATPGRAVGPGQPVRIRRDSTWSVPEPELTLAISSSGKIVGFTVGNDMSSRDIEGENPLYLPQAKIYDGSCALGPAILVAEGDLPDSTAIRLEIERGEETVLDEVTTLSRMKRRPRELVEYLLREYSCPSGCFLMTGTGIVPPSDFTLAVGDQIRITIEPIGTLVNSVSA